MYEVLSAGIICQAPEGEEEKRLKDAEPKGQVDDGHGSNTEYESVMEV